MLQLICHLIGDFFLQTDKMALIKKENSLKGFFYCVLHCILYSLPFFLITTWPAVMLIAISHFIIDRFHWLEHLIAWKNQVKTIDNFGFSKERPFAITIWLYIIHDNAIHLICNYFIISLWII